MVYGVTWFAPNYDEETQCLLLSCCKVIHCVIHEVYMMLKLCYSINLNLFLRV